LTSLDIKQNAMCSTFMIMSWIRYSSSIFCWEMETFLQGEYNR